MRIKIIHQVLRNMTLVKRVDGFRKAFSRLTGFIFTHMSFLVPAERLRETDTLLAFHHPRPAYPFHVVLVPRQAIPDLMALDPSNAKFLSDLFEVVGSLVTEFQLPAYRLIVNGGEYQEFPHLHFHLISGE